MQKVTFIHAADLHLDSPFQNVDKLDETWIQHLRESTWRSFDNLIDLAIEKEIDFLLIAGDIFNKGCHSLRAELLFYQKILRLTQREIHVYIIYGNHDPVLGQNEEHCIFLDNPYVHIFPSDQVKSVPYFKNGIEVARIYGRSFWDMSVCDDPISSFLDAADKDSQDIFKIAMIHGRVGEQANYLPYPTCSLTKMIQSTIHYWAMGHVHQRKIHHEQVPCVINPGSIQGASADECGPKGCYLVEWQQNRITSLTFQAIEAIRWEKIVVNIEEISFGLTIEKIIDLIRFEIDSIRSEQPNQSLIIQVIFEGYTSLYAKFDQQHILDQIKKDISCDQYLVAEIVNKTLPYKDRSEVLQSEPSLRAYAEKLEQAKWNKNVFENLEDALQLLYGNSRFQEITETKPNQRGKGQWKIKRIKQDWIDWLQDAETIGITIWLSMKVGNKIDLMKCMQFLQSRQIELLNGNQEGLSIMQLVAKIEVLMGEVQGIKDRQLCYRQMAMKKENVDIADNCFAEIVDNHQLNDLLQLEAAMYGQLFSLVKRWTIVSIALWGFSHIGRREMPSQLAYAKIGRNLYDENLDCCI